MMKKCFGWPWVIQISWAFLSQIFNANRFVYIMVIKTYLKDIWLLKATVFKKTTALHATRPALHAYNF